MTIDAVRQAIEAARTNARQMIIDRGIAAAREALRPLGDITGDRADTREETISRALLALHAQNERMRDPTPAMINAAWNEVRKWWPVGQPVKVDQPQPGFREALQTMVRAAKDQP